MNEIAFRPITAVRARVNAAGRAKIDARRLAPARCQFRTSFRSSATAFSRELLPAPRTRGRIPRTGNGQSSGRSLPGCQRDPRRGDCSGGSENRCLFCQEQFALNDGGDQGSEPMVGGFCLIKDAGDFAAVGIVRLGASGIHQELVHHVGGECLGFFQHE